jgi:hypothetical protein
MPAQLTDTHRRLLLEFVAQHSPDGEPFHLETLLENPQDNFGIDLGWGLVMLACEDLCGIEDPDIVWSTPEGLAALKNITGA